MPSQPPGVYVDECLLIGAANGCWRTMLAIGDGDWRCWIVTRRSDETGNSHLGTYI